MPTERPFKIACFINREDEDFQEIKRFRQAVILDTHDHDLVLAEDTVAKYATHTKLVTKQEVTIAILPRGRYLIHLPNRVSTDMFIKATRTDLWDLGFSFWPWTPLEEAAISIPSFRLLIGLSGIPVYMWKESAVMRAVASIGTYLGSVELQNLADFREYTVVVAIDNLQRVLEFVTMFVGDFEHSVMVRVLKVMPGLIYTASNLPEAPLTYTRPYGSINSSNISDDEVQIQSDDGIHMSKKVLLEICQGRDISTIPEELWSFLAVPDKEQTAMVAATQHVTSGRVTSDPAMQIMQFSPAIIRREETVDLMIHEAAEVGQHIFEAQPSSQLVATPAATTNQTPKMTARVVRDLGAAKGIVVGESPSGGKLPKRFPKIMLDTPKILQRGQLSTPATGCKVSGKKKCFHKSSRFP